ncbi:MAG: hypothetical protein LUG87_00930, partial [Oscillospiraceae bacterium]|nr:hypothetical protein [Oscillospiraceae bacterium]
HNVRERVGFRRWETGFVAAATTYFRCAAVSPLLQARLCLLSALWVFAASGKQIAPCRFMRCFLKNKRFHPEPLDKNACFCRKIPVSC